MTDQQDGTEKLHGWKEIARHFNRTPRTVQRWEREFRLPIHRIGLGKAEVVYALRSELEAWGRERAALPPIETAPESANPPPVEQSLAMPAPWAKDSLPPTARGHRRRRRWWGGLALLCVVLGAVLISWRLATWHPGDRLPAATKAVVEANTLRVLAADGRELWSYRFEHPVEEASYVHPRFPLSRPLQFEDLDGDGTRELLAVATFTEPGRGYELHCFEADGRRRFTWTPSRSVTYGANRWEPPYSVYSALVANTGGPPTLWVSAVHHLYFPAVLSKLDRTGQIEEEFWTDGHITALASGDLLGRQVLLAGGTHNEFKGAGFVVVDQANASGSTPALNPAYRCDDCPPGQPLASIVFPVPDLPATIAEGRLPGVMNFLPNDAGGLSVGVGFRLAPTDRDRDDFPAIGALYEFDKDLRPIRAEFSAQYIDAHRRAEEAGLLDHPFDPKVEERQLFPILSWNGSTYVPVSPAGR